MLPIVIVDDVQGDISLATRVLAQCRILNPVAAFTDAAECIQFIEAKGDFKNRIAPFLLLADLAMKPLSGVDVLCALRKASETSHELRRCVAVMLSGVQDLNLVNEGYKCGATTFLTKPLRADDVMQMSKAVKKLKLVMQADGNEIVLT